MRSTGIPQLETVWSARRNPYKAKTISLYPLAVYWIR